MTDLAKPDKITPMLNLFDRFVKLFRRQTKPAADHAALLRELDGVLFNTTSLLQRLAESNQTTGWTKWDNETMRSLHDVHVKVLDVLNPKPVPTAKSSAAGWD